MGRSRHTAASGGRRTGSCRSGASGGWRRLKRRFPPKLRGGSPQRSSNRREALDMASSSTRNRIPSSRSDVGKLCGAIARHPNQQCTMTVVRGWPPEKFDRVLANALADEAACVSMLPGGRSVSFRGRENLGGTNGVGLYRDVSRIIETRWAPDRHCRDIEMHATARLKQRSGRQWVVPDLVMENHPGRKAHPDVAKLIQTFEVETAGGFGLQSVYQAHAQGRGADLSWVVFQRGADVKSTDHPDWDRILWSATQLGVGLVGFVKSTSVKTWKVEREATRRRYTKAEREAFLETVLARR